VVWRRKKSISDKITVVKLMVHDWHVFFSFERIFLLQYYTRKTRKGQLSLLKSQAVAANLVFQSEHIYLLFS